MPVAITENFNDAQGRFLNYDTDSTAENISLANRKHKQIRSFVSKYAYDIPNAMYAINLQGMTAVDLLSMQDLEGTVAAPIAETWTGTGVTTGFDSAQK